MTNNADSQLLRRFERLEFEPGTFRHADHVQTGYDMSGRYDFVDACARFASTIRAMAESAGVPEKYNATITIAFLSLIAERRSQSDSRDLGSFLASNPDLLEKDLLKSWYSEERLNSPLAREQFLLPNKANDSHIHTV